MQSDNITLYNKICFCKNNTIMLYGQYTNAVTIDKVYIEIDNPYEILFSDIKFADLGSNIRSPNSASGDFLIKIKNTGENILSVIPKITFYSHDATEITVFKNVELQFPLDEHDLQLSKASSAIICTMCKTYTHRLDEWIQYHLNLGFSGVVIFNNDTNDKNSLHENIAYAGNGPSLETLTKKYKNKIFVINFPYYPLPNVFWSHIQRAILTIGVNFFKDTCKHIAIIDADEFIYLHAQSNIENFLQNHDYTLGMQGDVLTNINTADTINNNVLELARYLSHESYPKIILHSNSIPADEFIITPHTHHSEQKMNKKDIMFFHCLLNERHHYNANMGKIDYLHNQQCTYS